MGLMSTLAKVAIGYAAARGVDKLSGGGGLGALLGGGAQIDSGDPAAAMMSQAADAMGGQAPKDGPLADMFGQVQQALAGSPLAAMGGDNNPLAQIMTRMQGSAPDMSAMMGAAPEGGGLLSSLGAGGTGLAGMLAAAGGMSAAAQGQSAETLLNSFEADTSPEAEEGAALMLRAMIMAAKSDGDIDAAERQRLLDTIGDADDGDLAFVQAQLAAPVDPEALAADTPEAQRSQVYAASLMSIRIDTDAEAQYLDRLARALKLDPTTVNTLHLQMGMKPLYR